MWNIEKIQDMKQYFAEHRKHPTGNFTEFVVRTYYCILRACANNSKLQCPVLSVSNRKICYDVYAGIYNKPDHDYENVIENCKTHLKKMGYIHEEKCGDILLYIVDQSLDFLLPEEHKAYLQKFNITQNIEEIRSEEYVEITESVTENRNNISTKVLCERCNGIYVLKNGRYGLFFGCSNFPTCKSTQKVSEVTYEILKRTGLAIYQVRRPCWKCGESIQVLSYFPKFDLCKLESDLEIIKNLYVIRLSMLMTPDKYLSQKYKTITICNSKKAGFSYIANTCPYCQSLQGSQMTLGKVYDVLENAFKEGNLSQYVLERLSVNEQILPTSEWNDVIAVVI